MRLHHSFRFLRNVEKKKIISYEISLLQFYMIQKTYVELFLRIQLLYFYSKIVTMMKTYCGQKVPPHVNFKVRNEHFSSDNPRFLLLLLSTALSSTARSTLSSKTFSKNFV